MSQQSKGKRKSDIADLFLILLLIFTPLALGTVHNWSIAIFAIASVIIFDLYFVNSWNNLKELFKLPFIKWCIFFIAVILFQLLLLPKTILKFLNPSTYALYQNYTLNYASTDQWRSLSIYPWSTIYELVKLISYGLIFLVILGRLTDNREPTTENQTPQTANPNLLSYLQLGCLISILTILFHSFVDFNLHITANALYFVVILALFAGMNEYINFNHRFLLKIINSIMAIGFFIAIFGIVYKFGGSHGKVYWIIEKEGGIFGPYINYDHYAGYMGMCTPLAIASFLGYIRTSSFFTIKGVRKKTLWFSSPEANKTILYLFFSIVMTASLFLSASRGGILSFSMAVIVFFFSTIIKTRRQRRKRIFLFVILAILLISIMIIWVGPEEWLNRFSQLNRMIHLIIREGPLVGDLRLSIWKDTIGIIKDFSVFGTGLGTFSHIFPKYRISLTVIESVRYAHGDYIQLFSEMGIFGLIFVVVFILFFVKKYIQVIKELI